MFEGHLLQSASRCAGFSQRSDDLGFVPPASRRLLELGPTRGGRYKMQRTLLPVFLIHGGADNRIPADHSREIFENVKGEKELWIVDDADHLGVYLKDAEEYQRRVLGFFRKNLLA